MDKHDKYEAVKQAWFEINEQLRNNKQEYIDYLKFSAKMYKQPYSDAVLVYQQNRNATKIAEYKKWGRLGRYVRRGSHGVAVFGKNHTCRYLYDVTQTGGKELPEMWTLTDRNTPELLNTLNNRYNINAGSVKECIEAMTSNSINSAPIAESVQNAISQMGLDTKQAEVYRHSLDSVVQFVVSQRCNLSGKIDLHTDVDVRALDLIKNARDMILFSRAVQHAAKDTLFEIEKEVIAIDRKNEALDNAKTAKQESTSDRVDDILQDLIKLKFSQEQILALKQAVVAAAQNGEHNIRHWVSVRYSPDELRHISSLLSDYYAQSVIEQTLDPKGILNDYYTYVNELNGRLKLSDMFSHHDYSDEQKAMLQQGFSEGISITVLNEVDERLTVDEIKTFFEMFHQAVDGQIDPHDVQIYLDKAVIEHSKKNVQAVEAQDNSVDTNSIGIVKGEKSFAEQVDDVLAGNANRYNDLKVCDTPQILLDVGCEQLPMFYTKRHLHDALKPKGNTGESIHYHGLNAEQIKKMPMLLENPVIIYDSLSRNDSIIIVTSELDNEKMPIIAAIKPNGKAKYDLELVESNFVMSFHGRNNFENQINRAVEQNKVLYYNKEKSQELFSVLGLQLSKGLNIHDSNIIIHQRRNIVKGTQQENIEYKNNSVTQQDKKIEPSRIIGLAENQLRPAVPNSSTSSITDSSGVVKSEKTFAEQINDVLNGVFPKYSNLKVCDTPQILVDIGCDRLPMLYTQRHLKDALHEKSPNNAHWHGLTLEQICNIPHLLESPAIIMDSLSPNKSADKSIVICLNNVDNDNAPIIVSVKPNGQGIYEMDNVSSNFITSIYGKENGFANYVERAAKSNNILFWDKEKSQALFSCQRLQLPEAINNLDSNIIIHQSRNIVKGTQQENIEYKNNSVTQQDKKIEPSRIIGLAENQLRPAVPNSSTSSITDSSGVVKSEKTFAEQINDVLNGVFPKYSNLKVCDTPQILVDIGCDRLPMLYTQRHLKDALHEKSPNNAHWHGLTLEQICNIPHLLESPAIIMDSLSPNKSADKSIVICLNNVDNDNAPIIVSVKPNGQGIYEMDNVSSNFITSIYGKENGFANYVERAAKSNNILFWDKEKSQALFSCQRLQLPEAINNLDSNIIIHQSRNIVKGKQQENSADIVVLQ